VLLIDSQKLLICRVYSHLSMQTIHLTSAHGMEDFIRGVLQKWTRMEFYKTKIGGIAMRAVQLMTIRGSVLMMRYQKVRLFAFDAKVTILTGILLKRV